MISGGLLVQRAILRKSLPLSSSDVLPAFSRVPAELLELSSPHDLKAAGGRLCKPFGSHRACYAHHVKAAECMLYNCMNTR